MKRILSVLASAVLLAAAVSVCPAPARVNAAGLPLNSSDHSTTMVWDMEAIPDDLSDWAIDRYVEMGWREDGEVGVSGEKWLPSGVDGKGADGSRALGWELRENIWGNSSYIVLSNDTTAVTDWAGATELYFYLDATEVGAAFNLDLLLYTGADGCLSLTAGAPLYYWIGGEWKEEKINQFQTVAVPEDFSGWVRVPLQAVYGEHDLSAVERIGFLTEHSKIGASVYFDSFALDRDWTDSPVIGDITDAAVVWNMESLPDRFDQWTIDKYVEMGWYEDGTIGLSAGNWRASGVDGKGYRKSRAIAWTQPKQVWGNTTYVVLANDPSALTNWTGATELYFYIDASEIDAPMPTDILLYTAANGDRTMREGAPWYYWEKGAWVESAVNEWQHMVIPAGYVGWVRIPIQEVYGDCDLRTVRRIGFLTEHNVENGTVYFDCFSVDALDAVPSFDKEALQDSVTQINLVPDSAPADSADYFCTWSTQGSVLYSGAYQGQNATVRDVLTDGALFGPNGWAYLWDEETRKDLLFVLDDGWDLPYSENGADKAGYYGSFILDEEKFPNYGDTYAQRMKTLVDKLKAAGWKGAGVWVCCQEDAAHTTGKGYDPAYWAERILWCKEAGITYWKIDWGQYYGDTAWRQFISDAANRLYPELVIEHITGDVGTNAPFGNGSCADKLPAMLRCASYSDVFRTYDVTEQLSFSTTFDRVGRMLEGAYVLEGDNLGLMNCEDELYLAATLGLSAGVMRSRLTGSSALDEAARLARWHRMAPSFDISDYPTELSAHTLSDAWTFHGDTWDSSIDGKTITQVAPAAVGRGIALPVVSATQGEEVPYVAAGRNAVTGAVAVGAFRRTGVGSANHLVYADVSLEVGALTGPIGVFGCYNSLTLTFDRSLAGKTILAQDLLGDKAYDITSFVSVEGATLRLPGDLLEAVGTSAASINDSSEPGLVLRIGDAADEEEPPKGNDRLSGTTYSVALPAGEGYSVSASAAAADRGGDFTFTVEVSQGYCGEELTVKANGIPLTGENGLYTISHVLAPQSVTVEGVKPLSDGGTTQGTAAETDVTQPSTSGTGGASPAPQTGRPVTLAAALTGLLAAGTVVLSRRRVTQNSR